MRPLAAINAIVFGSAAAISFGLLATAAVFLILRSEQPQLAREFPALIRGCLVFLALAGTSGASLYGTLKQLRWQYWAQGAMWLTLATVGYAYWPK